MDHARKPDDQAGGRRGEPGSEDQYARAAGAPEIGAELADESDGLGPDGESPIETDMGGDAAGEVMELRRQIEEQRDKYLRLAAEFDNFRKRANRERSESGARAQADLVKQLLEVVDDIGRFSQFDPASTDSTTLAEGIDMVERKLHKSLTTAGLELVQPANEPFDPNVHEAVATEPALSPEDDNLVSQVYQVGYLFNGQLLRPARVVVKQFNG